MLRLLAASLHLTARWSSRADARLRTRGTCFASKISLWKDSQMLSTSKFWKSLPVIALSLFLLPTLAFAQYTRTDLVTDSVVGGTVADPHLVNGWGLTALPGSPWWVSDNVTGLSTLYAINNSAQGTSASRVPLVVTIPSATKGGQGSPTGVVANTTGGFNFTVNGVTNS